MDPAQLKLFQKITLDYFTKLSSGDEPELEDPYLQFGEPEVFDYTSLVEIHGEYDGCIYLTSPRAMLEGILEINGESEVSERTLSDMSRELSNVLAGNASQAFAGNWEISVPKSLEPENFCQLELPESTFVMPISWRRSKLLLVVGLTHAEGGAA